MAARVRALAPLFLMLLVMLAPVPALACPYCAAKEDASGTQTALFILSMMILPLLVGGVALVIIRRMDRVTSSEASNKTPNSEGSTP